LQGVCSGRQKRLQNVCGARPASPERATVVMMPWTIASTMPPYAAKPAACPECGGTPPDWGGGSGQCLTCRAVLVAADPDPGSVIVLELIPCRPPRRRRRSIEVRWGERVQADRTTARVYRLVDRLHDRYAERIVHSDGSVHDQSEPLSRHRGHGSARRVGDDHQS